MKVVVIGAGVIGCATAYHLCCLGYEVTLLDSAGAVGTGTSYANGGQLSYAYVEPFASPSTLFGIPKMLFNPQSPARFKPSLDYRQWLWGAQFLAKCTPSQNAKGTAQLLAITTLSFETLSQWIAQDELFFDFKQNGKLILCKDAAMLNQQAKQLALQAPLLDSHGITQTLLMRDECIVKEPMLAHYEGFVGGIWTATECAGDAHLFCHGLVQAAKRRGLTMVLNQTVEKIIINQQGKAVAVKSASSEFACDAVVITTGIQAPQLARALGDYLPIYPIKGYSISVPFKNSNRPTVNVTDLANKTVFAPISNHLRVAAVGELAGYDLNIPEFRLKQMVDALGRVYPGLCNFTDLKPWAGLRPATPSAVPIVRTSRVPNVVYNVGHGALGFTLAPGCAVLAEQLLKSN